MLIYQLHNHDQPQEVGRFLVTKMSDYSWLSGSFHGSEMVIWAPGAKELQRIELLSGKWEHTRVAGIFHNDNILMVQSLKSHLIATSTRN
ncbi:unnamed protein product [Sphagnum balticum]